MARGELLSLLGLYQYDNSIFDKIVVPNEINKEALVNNLLLDCAEFEILYPNPNIMKEAIGFWSNSRIKAWEDMKNVLIVENYRPFINLERRESGYDREDRNLYTREDESSNSTINTTDNSSVSSNMETTSNLNGEQTTESSSTQDLDSTTTNKVSAFNSSNFENKEQSIVDSTTTTSGEESQTIANETTTEQIETSTESKVGSNIASSTNSSNINNSGTIRKDYEHVFEGDSAMFTKQNIIEQEMEIRLKYDLYKIIIDEFKMKFCLLIY